MRKLLLASASFGLALSVASMARADDIDTARFATTEALSDAHAQAADIKTEDHLPAGSYQVASIHGGFPPAPVAGCNLFPGYLDGCTDAPANGVFTVLGKYGTTFAVRAQQSSQTWSVSGSACPSVATTAHPWCWNAPAIDYKTAYDSTLTLVDTAVAATGNGVGQLPSGCIYNATGNTGGGQRVTCTNVTWGTGGNPPFIEGLTFHNGTGCVELHFVNGTNPPLVKNNNFQNDTGCDIANGHLVDTIVNATTGIDFEDNLVNGNAPTSTLITDGLGLNGNTGPVTVKYNAFINMPNYFATGINTNAAVVWKYNYLDGYAISGSGLHGAIFENLNADGATLGTMDEEFNVALSTSSTPASAGTSAWTFLSAKPANEIGVIYASATVANNVVVSNKNGATNTQGSALLQVLWLKAINVFNVTGNFVDPTGALFCVENTGGTSATVAGKVDNLASGAGNTLTVTSIGTGAIFPGGVTFSATGVTAAIIQPFGSTCDGAASTGTGHAGTYCLGGSAQLKTGMTDGITKNTFIGTLNFGGAGNLANTNLTDGSTITLGTSVQWTDAVCNGHA